MSEEGWNGKSTISNEFSVAEGKDSSPRGETLNSSGGGAGKRSSESSDAELEAEDSERSPEQPKRRCKRNTSDSGISPEVDDAGSLGTQESGKDSGVSLDLAASDNNGFAGEEAAPANSSSNTDSDKLSGSHAKPQSDEDGVENGHGSNFLLKIPKPKGLRPKKRTAPVENDDERESSSSGGEIDVGREENSPGRNRHDSESSESNESKEEEIGSKFQPPSHRWFACKAFRNREYGLKAKEGPDWFRYRVMGSLHMVQRLELMYKMENHEGCVNCLNFNASGTKLASGSDDTNVTIWDWTTGDPLLTFDTKHRGNVFQAKFMPLSGDCHIVTCARDGQVRLAELSVRGVCKETRKLAQHRGPAHKLALEADSPHVFLTCGEDAAVIQIDLRDPKPNKLFICRADSEGKDKVPLYSVHSNPRNSLEFATSGRDQFCRIYDKRKISPESANPVKKYCPHHLTDSEFKANVTCVAYNFDGSELLASYNDEDIYSFDTSHSDGAEYIRRFGGHRNSATVKGVNWYGPCSEFIVSGSDCGNIFLWEKESEKIVHFMAGDEGGVVNCLEPHPTMPVLATSGLDHDVKIWVPSCEEPEFKWTNLRKLIKENSKERERERREQPDMIDAQMFSIIMQHFRRMRQRRDHDNDGEQNESSDDTDVEENSDDDEENDSVLAISPCRTS